MSTPASGFLLVASPDLGDPNFAKAVVLMLAHGDEGSFGLILNRPLGRTLGDVLDGLDPRGAQVPLLQGGPVQLDRVQFVVGGGEHGHALIPGVHVGVDLDEAVSGEPRPVHAYAGYSGWGRAQLERETEEGSWIVAPASAAHVFEIPADALWAHVLRELGGEYAWMGMSDGDPGAN